MGADGADPETRPLSEILQAIAVEIGRQHATSLAVQQMLGDRMQGAGSLTPDDMAACQGLDTLSQSLASLSAYLGDLAAGVPPGVRAATGQGGGSDTFVSLRARLFDIAPASDDADIEIFAGA